MMTEHEVLQSNLIDKQNAQIKNYQSLVGGMQQLNKALYEISKILVAVAPEDKVDVIKIRCLLDTLKTGI